MTFEFHPEADEEFVEAVAYYEDCDPGLGIDFSREVYATIRNAIDYPTLWPEIEDEGLPCLRRLLERQSETTSKTRTGRTCRWTRTQVRRAASLCASPAPVTGGVGCRKGRDESHIDSLRRIDRSMRVCQ